MKKYINIILLLILMMALFSTIIVDIMADPLVTASRSTPINQGISYDQKIMINSFEMDDASSSHYKSGSSSTALLSMLLVGLTLVGIAGFKEGSGKERAGRPLGKAPNWVAKRWTIQRNDPV